MSIYECIFVYLIFEIMCWSYLIIFFQIFPQPMHDEYDLRQEQLNKYSLLSSKKFLEALLDTFKDHVVHSTGALVISAMLDFLTFSLCAPYSETTDGSHFDTLLEMVAANGRIVFKLFQVWSYFSQVQCSRLLIYLVCRHIATAAICLQNVTLIWEWKII